MGAAESPRYHRVPVREPEPPHLAETCKRSRLHRRETVHPAARSLPASATGWPRSVAPAAVHLTRLLGLQTCPGSRLVSEWPLDLPSCLPDTS